MCNETMRENPAAFFLVSGCFKTQEMCIKAVEVDSWQLDDVPNHFETQGVCDNAVWEGLFSLQFVPDWFVAQEQIDLWDDDDNYHDDEKLIKCYEDHKERKAQKAKIEGELIRIAWPPLRLWDCCTSEDGKRDVKKLFLTI